MKNEKGQFTSVPSGLNVGTAESSSTASTATENQTVSQPVTATVAPAKETNATETKVESNVATVVEDPKVELPQVATLSNPISNEILGLRKAGEDEATVDSIQTKLGKGYSRKEVLDALRELEGANGGRLLVGRKGNVSRFLYNARAKSKISAIKPQKHNMPKRAYHKRNVEKFSQPQAQNQGLALKIKLGGIEQVFPLEMSLTTVAA